MKKILSAMLLGWFAWSLSIGGTAWANEDGNSAEANNQAANLWAMSDSNAAGAWSSSAWASSAWAGGWGWGAAATVAGNPCGPMDVDSFEGMSVKDMLAGCEPDKAISSEGDYKVEGGARDKVIAIANQLILAGSILSVGAIVYAGILYTIAAGDDERIKKAKGSLKFGIIGFVMMLLSFPLVNAIIKLIYSTSG